MKKMKRSIAYWLVCLAAIAALVPQGARAAEKIDTSRDVTLEIRHQYNGTPIPDAAFAIYRVADVDPLRYGGFLPCGDFAAYPMDLETLDQDDWAALALTLGGYVQRDGLTPLDSGKTDGEGRLVFPSRTGLMKPGLYLVIGQPTKYNGHRYTAAPVLVALPAMSDDDNAWEYTETVQAKLAEDVELTELRVLKVWDDDGYQSRRPQEITVQLLRDGQVHDTATLNEENGWRHSWEELDPEHTYMVTEVAPAGYTVLVEQRGVTFVITNSYKTPVLTDPPVSKVITGDKPDKPHTFTFIMTALDKGAPMPADSVDGEKRVTITGEGSIEFGEMVFTESGTYRYRISEQQERVKGYTFDTTVYELIFTVTEESGALRIARELRTESGAADRVVFTNRYKKPDDIPQTGMLWWPVGLLAVSGLAFIVLGVTRRMLSNKNEK